MLIKHQNWIALFSQNSVQKRSDILISTQPKYSFCIHSILLCSSKKNRCIWLPNLDGFISILSNREESVRGCSWAKCVSCICDKSCAGVQTGCKWWIDSQSASAVSCYKENKFDYWRKIQIYRKFEKLNKLKL